MIAKTVFMLSVAFVPLAILSSGTIASPWVLFGLYIVSGLGMAGTGMCVMHDANHGSYSKSRRLNKYLGYTLNMLGGNSTLWKIQHNVLHHTYTNITDSDDDINTPFFLRFSPNTKKYWLHRYQHVYVWFFYGLSTLSWVTSKDFVQLRRYHKMGFFKTQSEFRQELFRLIGWKLLYYSYTLILPLIMVPLDPWMVLLGFVAMHFVTGLSLSLVFQTAHIMPANEFPKPDQHGIMEKDWALHQLATTCNYAPGGRLFSWLIGGLNYQIEHHLLPNVCHVHYRKLSRIVAETAREYGIPYHSKRTFIGALWDHVKMLVYLGKMEFEPSNQR